MKSSKNKVSFSQKQQSMRVRIIVALARLKNSEARSILEAEPYLKAALLINENLYNFS